MVLVEFHVFTLYIARLNNIYTLSLYQTGRDPTLKTDVKHELIGPDTFLLESRCAMFHKLNFSTIKFGKALTRPFHCVVVADCLWVPHSYGFGLILYARWLRSHKLVKNWPMFSMLSIKSVSSTLFWSF
jgi:hypothetical protein